MSEPSDEWYMRARGRILGPFTRSQLESMCDRGQLSQFHELSQDRRSWIGATEMPELFSKPRVDRVFWRSAGADQGGYTFVEQPGAGSATPGLKPSPSWFFVDGTHHGPLHLADLQRMAASGEVGPDTLVWRGGMANWVPASQVPELRFPAPADSPGKPMPYPPQGTLSQPHANQRPRSSGLAIASFVLGLLALFGFGSMVAIVFGGVASNWYRGHRCSPALYSGYWRCVASAAPSRLSSVRLPSARPRVPMGG